MKLGNPVIKVCGMRDTQNIRDVANLQPDMMGFIFFPSSKRFVTDDFILPDLHEDIQKVGVFVNEEPEKVIKLLQQYSFHTAQLHGNESPEDCLAIESSGYNVMKSFGIDDNINWGDLKPYLPVTTCFVFDTKTSTHGGSGKKFNWDILNSYALEHPFLLSGGIRPEDSEMLEKFHHPKCIGFDINSGFEILPAFKDVTKLKAFIKKVRQKNKDNELFC